MLSSSSCNFLRASLSSSSCLASALINIVVVVLVTFDFLLLTLHLTLFINNSLLRLLSLTSSIESGDHPGPLPWGSPCCRGSWSRRRAPPSLQPAHPLQLQCRDARWLRGHSDLRQHLLPWRHHYLGFGRQKCFVRLWLNRREELRLLIWSSERWIFCCWCHWTLRTWHRCFQGRTKQRKESKESWSLRTYEEQLRH